VQAAVSLSSCAEVALVAAAGLLGLEGGFAVGGELVATHMPSWAGSIVAATAISCGCDSTSAGSSIRPTSRVSTAPARGERAVQDGGGDQRQGPEQAGGPQLPAGRAGGAVLDVGEPAGGGAGPAV
jgi:hypothetical protein